MNFIQAFFISSLRFLNIFIMAVVKSVSCASAKLPLSGNFTIGVLASGGIIIVFVVLVCAFAQGSRYLEAQYLWCILV